MMHLTESDNSALVTPDFTGTDDEKISVINYWAELIGLIRSIDASVSSLENKLAIISQIKKEIELIELSLTNATAQPIDNGDGAVELKKATKADKKKVTVDIKGEKTPGSSQSPNYPSSSIDTPNRPLATTEDLKHQLKKLAGIK
jgi:hypothetical protein